MITFDLYKSIKFLRINCTLVKNKIIQQNKRLEQGFPTFLLYGTLDHFINFYGTLRTNKKKLSKIETTKTNIFILM